MHYTDRKLSDLKERLERLASVVVAFSGGVDSTFLLTIAKDVLGSRVVAVTEDSELMPREEFRSAVRLASDMGVAHMAITTSSLDDPLLRSNPIDRCYFCKRSLFEKIRPLATEKSATVIDGTNADDLSDYRPGLQAALDFGVFHPLSEASFTKKDIRQASRSLGLPTWDKEATPCLATRIAYGIEITKPDLKRIEQGESVLKGMGFSNVRLRLLGDEEARIEVSPEQVNRLVDEFDGVSHEFEHLGLSSVEIDHDGYKTGKMNPDLGSDD